MWPFIQCPDEELCAMPCDHQPECTAEDEYDESVDIGCSNEDINSAHELFATDVEQGPVSFLHFYFITNISQSTKFHHLNVQKFTDFTAFIAKRCGCLTVKFFFHRYSPQILHYFLGKNSTRVTKFSVCKYTPPSQANVTCYFNTLIHYTTVHNWGRIKGANGVKAH